MNLESVLPDVLYHPRELCSSGSCISPFEFISLHIISKNIHITLFIKKSGLESEEYVFPSEDVGQITTCLLNEGK